MFKLVASRVRYGTTILKPKAEIICRNAPLIRKQCVTLTLKRTLLPTHFLHEVSQAIILQNQQPNTAPLPHRKRFAKSAGDWFNYKCQDGLLTSDNLSSCCHTWSKCNFLTTYFYGMLFKFNAGWEN